MPQPKNLPSDAWMDNRVEAYIDDALPPDEHAQFEARLWADPQWQEQVKHARRIQSALQFQGNPSPPTDLTDTILRHASLRSCTEKNT